MVFGLEKFSRIADRHRAALSHDGRESAPLAEKAGDHEAHERESSQKGTAKGTTVVRGGDINDWGETTG